MKPRSAQFNIIRNRPDEPIVIEDLGPWDRYPTITNDAETVVAMLQKRGYLEPGRRIFYYDSDGQLDEILHDDGVFRGFKAGPDEGKMSSILK